jgi:hypothetical protein
MKILTRDPVCGMKEEEASPLRNGVDVEGAVLSLPLSTVALVEGLGMAAMAGTMLLL